MKVTVAHIQAVSQLTDLPIPDEYLDGVATQLTTLLDQAHLVLGQPLDPTVEPAALFRP